MEKLVNWIFLIVGIALLLPLVGVALGGADAWILAIGLLLVGLIKLMKK